MVKQTIKNKLFRIKIQNKKKHKKILLKRKNDKIKKNHLK